MGGMIEEDDDDSPEAIVKAVKDCRKDATSSQAEWRDEARESYDMVAGKQWAEEDANKLTSEGRVAAVFNRLGTIIDAVSGSEVNNRQEVRYIPREIGDVAANEVLTGAAQWVRDNCDAEDEESDAFVDVLVSGMGWTETRMDYEHDEEGKCFISRVDPLEMRWDPAARKRNLADARWVQRERGFTREEIEARWPDAELPEKAELDEKEDEALQIDHKPDGYVGAEENKATKRKLYSVIHHQWYDIVPVYKVLSPDTGQIIEVPEDRYPAIEQIANMQGLQIKSAKISRREYKQAFVCGETLLEAGPAPCKHDFTFQAITGRRDRNAGTWYGLVRPMKDPQRWANKFFSQLLHIINTNAKGGLMVEQGAVENMRKFEKDFAKADSIVKLNPGGSQKVAPKPIPVIPPAISELMNFSISSIRDTSGVSLELLGMADREQAGYLEAQRTKAGLTILAGFFDALRLYRKKQGRVLAYFIQEYLSDGRLVKIVGKDGERFIPLLKNPELVEFDVVVDDSPVSRDMKERTWATLMQMLPIAKDMGMPIPPDIVKYSPLPSALIASWQPMLQQAQKPKPEQQAMQQLQIQQAAADVEKTQAAADQAQATAQLNYIKAQVESMAPVLQAIQMALGHFVPKPGPGGDTAQQQPAPAGFSLPNQAPAPTPFQ